MFKNIKKIFFLPILFISIFLLVYTFYRSEIYWGGQFRNKYNLYYFLSICLFLLSLLYIFLNNNKKTYYIIIILSLITSLYLFESYSLYKETVKKYNDLNKKIKLYKSNKNLDYDIRNKREIYEDELKINNVSMSVSPKSFFLGENSEIIPFSGFSNIKTIDCNENGYYSIFKSDRFGFNNPDHEWSNTEIEYFLVGDSFTFGSCVNRPYDIASVLRKITNKTVLNLGQGGNGPLIEYATLREYLNPKVKNIIWIYFSNDLTTDLGEEIKSKILIRYLEDDNFSQNLINRQDEINKLVFKRIQNKYKKTNNNNYNKITNFIKLTNLRNIIKKSSQKSKAEEKKILEKFNLILKRTKIISKQNESNLYFVYIPSYNHLVNNIEDKWYAEVKDIIHELNIPMIEIYNELIKFPYPKDLFALKMPNHYNIEGYRRIANIIHNEINKKN